MLAITKYVLWIISHWIYIRFCFCFVLVQMCVPSADYDCCAKYIFICCMCVICFQCIDSLIFIFVFFSSCLAYGYFHYKVSTIYFNGCTDASNSKPSDSSICIAFTRKEWCGIHDYFLLSISCCRYFVGAFLLHSYVTYTHITVTNSMYTPYISIAIIYRNYAARQRGKWYANDDDWCLLAFVFIISRLFTFPYIHGVCIARQYLCSQAS